MFLTIKNPDLNINGFLDDIFFLLQPKYSIKIVPVAPKLLIETMSRYSTCVMSNTGHFKLCHFFKIYRYQCVHVSVMFDVCVCVRVHKFLQMWNVT